MAFNWFKKKNKKEDTGSEQTEISGSKNDKSDTTAVDEETTPGKGTASGESEMPPVDDFSEPAIDDPAPLAADENGTAQEAGPSSAPLSEKKGGGLFARLKRGLSKTRKILTTDIDELFLGKRVVDDEMLEDLEGLLITSDIGVQTTIDLMANISKRAHRISGAAELKDSLKEEILRYFTDIDHQEQDTAAKPKIVMVVGVNGVGKTTTIGKLAAKEAGRGKKVLIGAADTFRAAAIEQIAIWADRTGADLVRHKDNADPAAVAYDSVEAAMSRGVDTVFIDTAGRLHTKINLMEELKKIKRSLGKKMSGAPHEVLLVLDATTGQNALSQARMFNEAIGVTSLALTKLDGTAKGGIVVSICSTLNIPLKYIGVGESVEDLQSFDAGKFIDAMF